MQFVRISDIITKKHKTNESQVKKLLNESYAMPQAKYPRNENQ